MTVRTQARGVAAGSIELWGVRAWSLAARPLVAAASVLALASPVAAGGSQFLECDGARPGAVLVVPLTPPLDPRPYPTFGFMFDGSDGHRYASTAGHVALGLDGGEDTWDGDGIIASDLERNRVGTFVYAIDTRTASQTGLPPGADLALIRVDEGVSTESEVCALDGPFGTDDRIVARPQLVQHKWFGAAVPVGRIGHPLPSEGPWLLPARSGVSLGMPDTHTVTVVGHASFGDSGAPVLTQDGLAVGWLSGPIRTLDEIMHPGSFVVSRITPAIERAEAVLGIALTLATA